MKILEVPIAPAIFEKEVVSKIQKLNKYKWEKYSISDTNFNTIIKRKKRNKNSRSYCCTIKICKR